jgi:hypothetical protein
MKLSNYKLYFGYLMESGTILYTLKVIDDYAENNIGNMQDIYEMD